MTPAEALAAVARIDDECGSEPSDWVHLSVSEWCAVRAVVRSLPGSELDPDRLARTEHYAGKYETLLCEALDVFRSVELAAMTPEARLWLGRVTEAMDFTKECTFAAPPPAAMAGLNARRYEWLREHGAAGSGHPFIAICTAGRFSQWTGDRADEMVDAAILLLSPPAAKDSNHEQV